MVECTIHISMYQDLGLGIESVFYSKKLQPFLGHSVDYIFIGVCIHISKFYFCCGICNAPNILVSIIVPYISFLQTNVVTNYNFFQT